MTSALARRAEELYLQLGPDEQRAARQVMLRLITLGEGSEDTRRRVRWRISSRSTRGRAREAGRTYCWRACSNCLGATIC